MSLKTDCEREYQNAYNAEYAIQLGKRRKLEKNRRKCARNKALDEAYGNVLVAYSADIASGTIDDKDIWNELAIIHKRYAADLTTLGVPAAIQDQVIESVERARQSWVRSSGLRFEDHILVAINTDPNLATWKVQVKRPKEVLKLIDAGKYSNDADDLDFIKRAGDRFDLYIVQEIMGRQFVVGCVQAKTSIRDRVDRDCPFSRQAMERHFWSIAITLDGEFLNNPLYREMVNGKTGTMHEINGWHGMYVLARVSTEDRIYKVDNTFSLLINHLNQALTKRAANTATFDNTWIAV